MEIKPHTSRDRYSRRVNLLISQGAVRKLAAFGHANRHASKMDCPGLPWTEKRLFYSKIGIFMDCCGQSRTIQKSPSPALRTAQLSGIMDLNMQVDMHLLLLKSAL